MGFQKAQPQQAKLKMGFYGPQGSGKTFTALLLAEGLAEGGRIAYVDTERGTDFYAMNVPERAVHPKAFDFDALYTRSLSDTLSAVEALDTSVYSVVIIDSISHLWDAAMDAYSGRKVGKDQDKIPMQAWGAIKRPYRALIRHLLDAPVHAFILGRQKNLFDTDDGEFIKIGVAMRAEGETEYEPHICIRMARGVNKDGEATIFGHVEKDRSGVLTGKVLANPCFDHFRALLPLLGGRQAQSEDPEEIAARDAELLDQAAKEQAKSSKSEEHYTKLNAKVVAAKNLAALGKLATEIKKLKRYMVEQHIDALRLVYSQRHAALAATEAPQEV